MGFLSKLFGGGSTLNALRQALAGERWAQALAIGEDIDRTRLEASERAELEQLLGQAGDGLAAFNLAEAEACLRAGEVERAAEHLSLAAGQARTPQLAERIARQQQVLSAGGDNAGAAVEAEAKASAASCCPSGCGDAGSHATGASASMTALDNEAHLELILATYPAELARRYEQASATFRQAFLLAHADQDQQARELLEQLAPAERDDLFYFERGSLLARLGETEQAMADLEEALRRNPDLQPALDALIRLELKDKHLQQAEARLRTSLDKGRHVPFCCGLLAEMAAGRGDGEEALRFGLQALEAGSKEPATLLLTASLLEGQGRLNEAEAILAQLGGGGCSGGGNLHQAEFWLRHGCHLDKALEAFKGAARHEPEEPRWPLRMAQVYLARGWNKDGIALLRKVLEDPRLAEPLRQEGSQQLQEALNAG